MIQQFHNKDKEREKTMRNKRRNRLFWKMR